MDGIHTKGGVNHDDGTRTSYEIKAVYQET